MKFHVARAFELLINDVVQAATGVDEAGGEDGEAAAVLDFSGGPEELAGGIEGDRVHPAGERPSAGREREVVGPGQPGEAVEQDADIVAGLDESLGAFEDQLGDLAMRLNGLVEGGTVDLSFNGPHHVRDLFGAFADESDHEVDVGRVGSHSVGDLFKDGGLAGLRRGNDHSALSPADGGHEVDESSGEFGALVFELDVFTRGDRREVLKVRPAARGVGVHLVDRVHANESEISLAVLGRADLAGNLVAGAEPEPADL